MVVILKDGASNNPLDELPIKAIKRDKQEKYFFYLRDSKKKTL
tara:strand:+ start:1479 stop:1607 length:129 start_codon:yes stop_codon:yes gene_type:complete